MASKVTQKQQDPALELLAQLSLGRGQSRDSSIALLGDRIESFKDLAHDFDLLRTSAFVEPPTPTSPGSGTTTFDVNEERTLVPSLLELSLTLSPVPSEGPQTLEVSLSCILSEEATESDREVITHALKAFDPTVYDSAPTSLLISFKTPRVDAVTHLEGIFELIHKPCGVERNMSLDKMCQALLELPQLNRRAITFFRERVHTEATRNTREGRSIEDSRIEKTLENLTRALGAITAFESRDPFASPNSLHRSATMVSIFAQSAFGHKDSLLHMEEVEHFDELRSTFERSRDIRGLCGITALVNALRTDAIFESNNAERLSELAEAPIVVEQSKELVSGYDSLINKCLSSLKERVMSKEDVALVETLTSAVETGRARCEARVRELKSEELPKGPPRWASNSFLLLDELLRSPKDEAVQAVFDDLLPTLRDRGEDLGASLIAYGCMNQEVGGRILEVIEQEALTSSAAHLVDQVFLATQEILPPELTTTMATAVNYLADQFAVERDVHGYQLGVGIVRDRSK